MWHKLLYQKLLFCLAILAIYLTDIKTFFLLPLLCSNCVLVITVFLGFFKKIAISYEIKTYYEKHPLLVQFIIICMPSVLIPWRIFALIVYYIATPTPTNISQIYHSVELFIKISAFGFNYVTLWIGWALAGNTLYFLSDESAQNHIYFALNTYAKPVKKIVIDYGEIIIYYCYKKIMTPIQTHF